MSVVKAVRMRDINDVGLSGESHSRHSIDDGSNGLKVFGSAAVFEGGVSSIEEEIGRLEQLVGKKLEINDNCCNQADELQVSRGPNGGKPTNRCGEHEPPSKFVKQYGIGDGFDLCHGYPLMSAFDANLSRKNVNVQAVGRLPANHQDAYDSMTVGDVLREKGMMATDHFRSVHPNPAYGRCDMMASNQNFTIKSDLPGVALSRNRLEPNVDVFNNILMQQKNRYHNYNHHHHHQQQQQQHLFGPPTGYHHLHHPHQIKQQQQYLYQQATMPNNGRHNYTGRVEMIPSMLKNTNVSGQHVFSSSSSSSSSTSSAVRHPFGNVQQNNHIHNTLLPTNPQNFSCTFYRNPLKDPNSTTTLHQIPSGNITGGQSLQFPGDSYKTVEHHGKATTLTSDYAKCHHLGRVTASHDDDERVRQILSELGGAENILKILEAIDSPVGSANGPANLPAAGGRAKREPECGEPPRKESNNNNNNCSDINDDVDDDVLEKLLFDFTSDHRDYFTTEKTFKDVEQMENFHPAHVTTLASPPGSFVSTVDDSGGSFSCSYDSEGHRNFASVECFDDPSKLFDDMVIHPDMYKFMLQAGGCDFPTEDWTEAESVGNANTGRPENDAAFDDDDDDDNNDDDDDDDDRDSTKRNSKELSPSVAPPRRPVECEPKKEITLSDDDLLKQDDDGDNILHIAAIHGKLELVEEVLMRFKGRSEPLKQITEAKNELGQTPLCLAVLENQPIMVKRLVEAGADVGIAIVSRKDRSFTRPLHFAASKGHLYLDCLRELLASQVIDVNSQDSDGKTPLLCAVKGHRTTYNGKIINSIPSIELLVEKGADLNKADGRFDMSALHFAIASKSFDLVSVLISLASIDRRRPNSPSKDGVPVGPSTINSTLAKMLSAKTGTGFSALHLAVGLDLKQDEHQLRLIQLLLSKGADPSSKNSEGQLPRELTRNQKIIELLKGIGLRRKPAPSVSSPLGMNHRSPGSQPLQSPRSVTSQGRMSSVNGNFSPANTQTFSPVHYAA